MKKLFTSRRLWLLLTLMIVGGFLWAVSAWGYVETPQFSHSSGFYEESFTLEISAINAATIYYTLDGSSPTENSLVYAGPIQIKNATQNPNNYAALPEVSIYFSDAYLQKRGESEYRIPDYPVDKCTVVRAIAVSPGGKVSDVASASYFVEQSPQDYGCNVISLITDPANLFDSTTGIYVTGDLYEQYVAAGLINKQRQHVWWNTNYLQSGREWERPALLQFFNQNGEKEHEQTVGVRIHGNFSRASLPRSLKFYARLDYDNYNTFTKPLFDSDYVPQTVTLFSGGNQLITAAADVLVTDMVRELNFAAQRFSPYVLFINGEYWGFYWLGEKYDEAYVAHYYNVQADNVVMIKDSKLETGEPGDELLYQNMVDFIYNNDMSAYENYQKACELIDMDSFIDYYATMIYIARAVDWPGTNVALWRTREVSPTSAYSDGKWRWMLFDCNSPCMREDANMSQYASLDSVIGADALFQSLWNSDIFRKTFEQRILYIGENCFAPEKVDAFIDSYTEEMKPILKKRWERFFGKENTAEQQYEEMMTSHSLFFQRRLAVVRSWFE